ncbi:MAG: hypothetical protein WCH78_09195 [Bacteroidota bacterium]
MKWLFVSLSFLFCFQLSAQKNKTVIGYLRDSVTHAPIVLGSVTNNNTHETVMSGNSGRFKIHIKENEVLSYAAVGYHFDTVQFVHKLAMQDSIDIFASPLLHDLGNVTVSSKGMSAYQMDSMERRNDLLHDMVSYKKPTFALSNSGAGLGISIDRFSKHEKSKRKALDFFEAQEKEEYINYRYSTKLVEESTGFKDETLRNFIQQSRPSYNWLRANTSSEDILYYINDQLKKFSGK